MHRMTVLYPRFQFCFNQPDGAMGAGAGGSSAVATPPVTSAPGAAPAPASGAPGSSATPAPPPSEFKYSEDRSKWINPNDPTSPYLPKHRVDEIVARERQQRELLEGKVRALMGIDAPEDPRKQALREALLEVMPELQDLGQLRETAGQGSSVERAYWARIGNENGRAALAGLAKAMNRDVKDFPPNALPRIKRELLGFIREDETGRRGRRYEDGDPTLIDEFVQDVTGFWVAPTRQAVVQANAQNVERNRRLPQTGPAGGVPPAEGAPAAPKSAKEVHESGRQRFLRSMGQ